HGPRNKLFRFYVCRELGQTTVYLNFKELTVSLKESAFARAQFTVCSSKGQALQLTSGLDFLSIQAYRLWMEHPSRGKVIFYLRSSIFDVGATGNLTPEAWDFDL